jgi:hypothetical protein
MAGCTRLRLSGMFVALLSAAAGFAKGQDVAHVAREVTSLHADFEGLSDLSVTFTLQYEHLWGPRNFILKSGTVQTKRSGGKRWLRFEGDPVGGDRKTIYYAWDGSVGTALMPDDFNLTKKLDLRIYHYDYYLKFLSYPDPADKIAPLATPRGMAAGRSLPETLARHTTDFTCRFSEEGGANCVLLEREGYDAFWFDPALRYALRRRDRFNYQTKRLINRTRLSNFRIVGGTPLPSSIIVEEYDDGSPSEIPTGRKVIEVSEFSTAPIAASEFRLQAPIGVTVHDAAKSRYFTRYGPGTSPIVNSAELARAKYSSSSSWPIALAAVVLLLLALFLIRFVFSRLRTVP